MAIRCELCGKKQSGWLQDYPLDPQFNEYRICANCQTKKENLSKGIKDYSLFIDAKNYFESNMGNIQNEEIKSFLLSEIKINQLKIDEQAAKLNQPQKVKFEELFQNEEIKNLKMTSGYNFEGYKIRTYIKILSSESVMGTGFISELSADLSDLFGVENAKFAKKIQEARDIAELRLKKQAIELNANALIGVKFEYINFSRNLIGVVITGTAVYVNECY